MKTMRAAQKTRLDPEHYQKIVDTVRSRRDAALIEAERLESTNPDDPEAYRLRRKCDLDYDQRIMSAMRQYKVAVRMVDQAREELKRKGILQSWEWPDAATIRKLTGIDKG